MKKPGTHHPVSYYDILQVTQNASDADIRRAYYKLAKRFHPDQNKDERKLAELRIRLINEAYENLKTKEKRMAYRHILNKNKKPVWNKPAQNDNTNIHLKTNRSRFLNILKGIIWPESERVS